MTTRKKFQIMVDLCMILLLPILMAYNMIGEVAHEYLGTAMVLLFIGHHLLNRHWYKSLEKGKHSKTRILSIAVNFMLLIIIVALALSGIVSSKHLFLYYSIRGEQTAARTIHLVSSYWGFVLMSFHMGLHGKMLLKIAKKAFCLPSVPRYVVVIIRAANFCISVYGVYAFVHRKLGEYMLLKTQYVFFDFSEPLFLFVVDYISIMLFSAFSGYYSMCFQAKADSSKP